jgi:hypothetical protein
MGIAAAATGAAEPYWESKFGITRGRMEQQTDEARVILRQVDCTPTRAFWSGPTRHFYILVCVLVLCLASGGFSSLSGSPSVKTAYNRGCKAKTGGVKQKEKEYSKGSKAGGYTQSQRRWAPKKRRPHRHQIANGSMHGRRRDVSVPGPVGSSTQSASSLLPQGCIRPAFCQCPEPRSSLGPQTPPLGGAVVIVVSCWQKQNCLSH